MEIQGDEMCFACGPKNPIGLKLKFSMQDEVVETKFTPKDVHQGFDGIMHGGLISTLLDEVMANVLYIQGIKAVTAKMEVKFRKPVEINQELTVTGWVERKKRRTINTASKIVNQAGEKVAEAEAVFMTK